MEKKTYPNHFSCYYHLLPHTHAITLGLCIKTGPLYETEKNQGISHLVEHLHFRRLGDMTQKELYYRMERMGTTLNGATSRDHIYFDLTFHPEDFRSCADIMAAILQETRWSKEEFEAETQVVLNQIYEKEMTAFVYQLTGEKMLDASYSTLIMGTEKSVLKLTRKQAVEWKRKWFTARGAALFASGCISSEHMAYLDELFSGLDLPEGGAVSPPLPVLNPGLFVVPFHDDYLNFEIRFEAEKTIPDAVVDLLECITGGGVGARLQLKVREELGYTADIASGLEVYEQATFMRISYSVCRENMIPCFKAVLRALEELKTGIGPEDLEVTRPFRINYADFLLD